LDIAKTTDQRHRARLVHYLRETVIDLGWGEGW